MNGLRDHFKHFCQMALMLICISPNMRGLEE